ncbi:cytochrome P450 [Aspergillus japonicus CBS 114.51]|uniref:Cytochrome P450 n=2 Tax=Aspergillus TaxID=5052 RepID=A0A2V5HIS0_ASPV1|nr:cytochrome P450 [Aspergillus japonicus CBS 114.51]PYI15980.1 cytochrome P450 [Aspergillus violaceofuscus CBS 115571]RAH86603.1 cytochrome P450 [Aspergillus japonicus CBS 114.51]
MSVVLTISAVAAILYVLWTLLLRWQHAQNARRWNCGSIPHYPGDWLGTNTLKESLRYDKDRNLPYLSRHRIEKMSASQNRYTTTFQFRQLGQDIILTCEPKNVQAVLAHQFKDFELGTPRRNAFHSLLGNGIFTADGEYWTRSRGLLRPQFTRDQISDLDLEERHVQQAMRLMPVDATGWTEPTDIQTIFFRLTLDSATEFLFGESVESQAAALRSGSKTQDDFATQFDRGQWYAAQRARFEKIYWIVNNKESREVENFVHAYVDRFVDAALNMDAEKKPSHYVFLHALAEMTRDPVELRSQLLNILLAGRDTTASLLSWCVLLLARHPEQYARLRAAVVEEFGSYASPKEITFAGLKGCKPLQNVLNETLRLYSIVPGNRRIAVKNTTIPTGGGPNGTDPVYVKKGQAVFYSTFVMHRRPDLWGADADEFRPERWESRKPGWEYLPFNGGPRICIGQQFALTEAGYVMVRLLQRFDQIEGVGKTAEGEIAMAVSLTNAPGDNVTVRLHEGN